MHICFVFHIGVDNLKESTKFCSICNLIRIQIKNGKNQQKLKYVIQKVIQTLAWKEAPVQAIGLLKKSPFVAALKRLELRRLLTL